MVGDRVGIVIPPESVVTSLPDQPTTLHMAKVELSVETIRESVIRGEPHIIWRRIGGHEIFDNP